MAPIKVHFSKIKYVITSELFFEKVILHFLFKFIFSTTHNVIDTLKFRSQECSKYFFEKLTVANYYFN